MSKKRGRPAASRQVKITPEYRDKPDIGKLGLVFMEAARQIAQQNQHLKTDNEGDGLP